MNRNHLHEEDHSTFNQTTEVGITLTADQAKVLKDSLDQATMMRHAPPDHTHTAMDLAPPTENDLPGLDEALEDTEVDPVSNKAILQLDQSHFEQRFLEIKRHVLGFHSLLEKGYETLVTVSGFPEFPEIRLRSISIYPSGALYVEGENRNGEWVSIFSHLDTISYALTKQRATQRKKTVQEIEFNFL